MSNAPIPRDVVRALRSKVARWPASKWSKLVVVASPEGLRVLPRADLHDELRRDGLDALAHEAVVRRVPLGSVLAYIIADSEAGAGVAFAVVGLR